MKLPFSLKTLTFFFVTLISLRWFSIFWGSMENGSLNFVHAVKETGELAWVLLIFMIMVSLAQKIVKIHFPKFEILDQLLPLRKWAGVFAFLIVATHASSEILKRGFNIENIVNTVFTTDNAAFLGATSFVIMLPLFLTSTKWATNRMGPKSWKALQRFSHLAFIFAGLHIALMEFFGRGVINMDSIIVLTIYALGYLYLSFRKKSKA